MTPCTHEPAVVDAARRGRVSPDLEAHVHTCDGCRELLETVEALTRLAADTDRLAARQRLPEAGRLWWKGQLARRWQAEARAVAPLDMMQRVEIMAGLAAAVVLLVTFAQSVAGALSVDTGAWHTWAAVAGQSGLPWIAGGAMLLVGVSLFMLRRVLED